MEDVGERPQQVIEIVFEPGVRQQGGEVIHDGGESATDCFGFGQRARIGFVPAGPVTIEGQFVEQMGGGRKRVRRVIGFVVGKEKGCGIVCHGELLFAGLTAPIAAFTAIPLPGPDPAGTRPGLPAGPQRSGGWRRAAILLRDAKPGALARRRKIVAGRHCRTGTGHGRSPPGKAVCAGP